jgi:4,5-DOPA dioxygenase extradiol
MVFGLSRRQLLQALAATASTPALGAVRNTMKGKGNPVTSPGATKMPVIFLAHGAPPLLEDAGWMGELNAWAQKMPRPNAILMISAHWEDRPLTIGATVPVPLVYDFYGFPRAYYQLTYPSPGAPALAERVRSLLKTAGMSSQDLPERGLDHGAFIPLMAMYPSADVPVLQISLPSEDPQELFNLGMALDPLRSEGVLIVGSGFLTHNLRLLGQDGVPKWAHEFDQWAARALGQRDFDTLLDYRNKAPGVTIALPTREHFVPVLVAAGASARATEKVEFPITGFWMDKPFTRRSVQFG